MKKSFNLPFFKKKIKNVENTYIEEKNNTNVVKDEKEILLEKLNKEQLDILFFRSKLDKNSISLELVKKFNHSPTLLDYLANRVFDPQIIYKINENNLRVSDIKEYDKEIFQYNIFSLDDKNLLDILRKDIKLSNKGYAIFEFDEFEKNISSNNYIDISVDSLIEGQTIINERKKVIPLPDRSIYEYHDINIVVPLNRDKIFSKDLFNYYYLENLSFNEDNILFISYNKFLDWIKDSSKLDILNKCQVIINDDYNKANEVRFNIKNYKYDYNYKMLDINYEDKLKIQINHLLYIIENSNLIKEEKDYYKYYIIKNFLELNNSSWTNFHIRGKIEELALSLKKKLDDEVLSKLTNDYNNLDIDNKNKKVSQIKFSTEIFLQQFNNLDNMSSFEFLRYVYYLGKEEKKEVLKNSIVINKIRGIFEEKFADEYDKYKEIFLMLEIEEFFLIFDSEFIRLFYKSNRHQVEYRLFYTMLEKDINKAMECILDDDEYLKEFVKDIDRYNFKKLDYSLLVKLVNKIEKNNLKIDFLFLSSTSLSSQYMLLKEDFDDEFLVKLVPNLLREVQQFFYLEDKRFNYYLWDKFNVLGLAKANYKMPDDLVKRPEFFDKFKGTSIVQFRANVNKFLINQPDFYFEEKIGKYEDELIGFFDSDSELFIQYKQLINNIDLLSDRRFINPGIDFFYDSTTNLECRNLNCIEYDDNDKMIVKDKENLTEYLKWLSKRKLNEVIIDRLFKDNIYNVFLNIKEMLRYNMGLSNDEKILNESQEEFYRTVLNIDNLDSKDILEIYNNFKDKNIALMFYEDIQNLKNKSYDKIKEELFQPENMEESKDKKLSSKYGVSVFDLREKEYVMLVRCLNSKHSDITYHKRDCYTILSNDNSSVFYNDNYIYGYSGFNNDCILHVFEEDSFSGDVKGNDLAPGSDRVNRIMTSKEIATGSIWYSEIQIVNKKSSDNEKMFETLRPSYLLVFDEISNKVLKEAKRKNIPICIISHSLNKDLVKNDSTIDVGDELKYISEAGITNESIRRKLR